MGFFDSMINAEKLVSKTCNNGYKFVSDEDSLEAFFYMINSHRDKINSEKELRDIGFEYQMFITTYIKGMAENKRYSLIDKLLSDFEITNRYTWEHTYLPILQTIYAQGLGNKLKNLQSYKKRLVSYLESNDSFDKDIPAKEFIEMVVENAKKYRRSNK